MREADGRFYPDFLCQLTDGVVLVVEYKGADRWASAEDDRLIGGLWAELSGGAYRLLELIREYDDSHGWSGPGLNSCGH